MCVATATGDSYRPHQKGGHMHSRAIERAADHFAALLVEQLERVERMKRGEDWVDYEKVKPIIIGICGGDGIGPHISSQAERVLKFLLTPELDSGKVAFKVIEGLTIENRAKHNKAIPDDVLEELKQCHVILKGPTTTPRKGDPWPNIESANVAMRRALDLFANVRPVTVPKEGIDWMFFRENTEGAYVLGSSGDKVTVVTKANVIKTTDGKFLDVAREVAKEYPEVEWDDWYIDIMTAKLVDLKRRQQFRVMVLPNLYGDILTDEAAEFQGGVGTAGSANIGKRYAMFEAIHGSAPHIA